MVLSNITVPLLGLVDAAVIGHLSHPWYLGGVALGGTMISMSFWLLGFLRMSTTGMTAQAFGAQDSHEMAKVLLQGVSVALFFAALFLAFHPFIIDLSFWMSDASDEVKRSADTYFSIRIWSAPASLTNYVLLGWLLGVGRAKQAMWMVIVTNVFNIIFDLLFVLGLGWQVAGAAAASVLGDVLGMLLGIWFMRRTWQALMLPPLIDMFQLIGQNVGRLLSLNRDIFLRSLCLQAVFATMTFYGASLGDNIIAANAVLMSFVMVISYAMDGFAYAVEALIGKAIGQKRADRLLESLFANCMWGFFICIGLSLIFFFAGNVLINSMTDIDSVRNTAYEYLPWLVAMPLVSLWCFIFDGLFIGATKGREMRNGMVLAMLSFAITLYSTQSIANHGLWLAMSVFMAMRGITLIAMFLIQWRRKEFIG
jgi:MATE family multidrug resistance protein